MLFEKFLWEIVLEWRKNSTQNETQCQECEREIICLAYFSHEAEQIGIEVHCVGRTIPLVISKKYLLLNLN